MTSIRNTFLALGAPIAASARGWLEGYGFLVSYSSFGLGSHPLEAYACGACFDASSVTLTIYARAFLRRPTVAYLPPDSAAPEDNLAVSWSGAQQGFVAEGHDPNTVPLGGNYAFQRDTVGIRLVALNPSHGNFTDNGGLVKFCQWYPANSIKAVKNIDNVDYPTTKNNKKCKVNLCTNTRS